MATGTDKFLNYNGLVKLIGLIKSAIGFKTNTFVKSIAGYGTSAAPSSTSGVNDTKNKLEGTYTTGALDGSGTDVTTNKFTYIDTTYGNASSSKAGLMPSSHWSIVDALDDAAATSKGSTLVGYGKTINNATRTTVTDALDALESEVSGKVDDVKQDNVSVVTNGVANIPHDILQCGFEFSGCQEGETVSDAYYNVLLQGAADNKAVKCDTGLVFVETSGQNAIILSGTLASEAGVRLIEINKTTKEITSIEELSDSTLVTTLAGYVPTSRKVNNLALTSNITIKSQDVPLTSNITIGGASKTNVQEALVALNTAVANAGDVDDVMQDNVSLVTNKVAHIPHDVLQLDGWDFATDIGGSSVTDAQYATLVQAAADHKVIKVGDTLVTVAEDTDHYVLCGVVASNESGDLAVKTLPIQKTSHSGEHYIDTGSTISASTISSQITTALASYVPTSRTINGTPLTSNVTLKSQDISLTTNISVDGTSKSNVQETLVALNTLAAANKTAIQSIQSAGLTRTIVTSLPTTDISETTIYMILASNDSMTGDPSTSASSTPYSSNNNSYNEYMYINSAWERIGSTEVNLDIDPITNDEIDTAWSTTSAAA